MSTPHLSRWFGWKGVSALCLAWASPALAFHIEMRWVERTGTIDRVIGGDGAIATFAPGTSHRIRVQFGVFDDAQGPAPAGGDIGWNIATLAASGGENRRTNGRISPFNFAPNPPGNGLPSQDPFTSLAAIDNTLGLQAPAWGCGADGLPLPMPLPTIRGLNVFVSTFELTTQTGNNTYAITLGGNTVVASGWGIIGAPTAPDCEFPDPPGSVVYAPMTLPPSPIAAALLIVVPGPGSGALVCALCLRSLRRRRLY